MSDLVVGYDTEHERDEGMAQDTLKTLVRHYPGHAWFIVIKGGVMHVKNLHFNDKWGMCLHYSNIKGDTTARTRSVVRAAGEFLERARVARGANTGERVRRLEGVPDKDMTRAGM